MRVHVILDQREKSVNSAAYSYLSSHAVKVTWSSPKYRYTHQKTVIIDGAEAAIMTANLTSRYYATSRDFLIVDNNRADVAAITAVFDADFAHTAVRPRDGSDLVWSPTDQAGPTGRPDSRALLRAVKNLATAAEIRGRRRSRPISLDAGVASSADPDLQHVGHPAGRARNQTSRPSECAGLNPNIPGGGIVAACMYAGVPQQQIRG